MSVFYYLFAGFALYTWFFVREQMKRRYLGIRGFTKVLNHYGGELDINDSMKLKIEYKTTDDFVINVLINGKIAEQFEGNLFFCMLNRSSISFEKPWKKDIECKLKEGYLELKKVEKFEMEKEQFFAELRHDAFASEYKNSNK